MRLRILTFIACSLFAVSAFAGPKKTKYRTHETPQQKHYKTVDESSSSSDNLFKGPTVKEMNNLFFGLGLNYFDSFGLQARYAYRVLDKVINEDFNNALYLEGGIGMTFYGTVKGTSSVTGVHFLVMGRWDFQMDKNWIFFPELGFGYNAVSNDRSDDVNGGGFIPAAGIGAIYNFDNSDWAARADFSYEFLGVGLMYRF